MKLYNSKILVFVLTLNILVTSLSNEHNNNNEPHSTPHHTQTNRSLCECDKQSSIYDNDADMKSVKENFHRQTSQRFEEYEERMKEKRQKRKEQRDKNIQKIIKKDKMEKKLAEKIEKGCLMCGCGLGGVAASVGIFGTVAVKELTKAAIATATELTKETGSAAMVEAAAKGAEAGKEFVIAKLQEMGISTLGRKELGTYITATNYTDFTNIARAISIEYQTDSCLFGGSVPVADNSVCRWVWEKYAAAKKITEVLQRKHFSTNESIKVAVKSVVSEAETVAERAVKTATEQAIEASTLAAESTYAG
ncbi:rifin, partial [Plasmodium reichenowi]